MAYSPGNNTVLKKIVNQVVQDLNNKIPSLNFTIVEHENADRLSSYLSLESPFVGIAFKDDLMVKKWIWIILIFFLKIFNLQNKNEVSKSLDYAIRFRHIDYVSNWRTDEMQDRQKFFKYSYNNEIYHERCFLMIQNSIDKAFIAHFSNKVQTYDVWLQVRWTFVNGLIISSHTFNYF